MRVMPLVNRFRLLFIVLAVAAILSILYPRFLTTSNLSNVMWSICVIAIMTTGAVYPPMTGGIDLSVGSIAALAGIIAVDIMSAGVPIWPALMLTVAIGTGIGVFSGLIVTKFKVHGFIATMAAKTYLFGIAMFISNGAWIAITGPQEFLDIGGSKLFGFPAPIYLMLLMVLLSHILLRHTVYGKQVLAVGANEVAANLSGVNIDRVKIIAYALSAATATIAGIVLASIAQQAFAGAAPGYELMVITAFVVGGTSLLGGTGSVVGALLGAVLVGFIENGLNLMNVDSSYSPIVIGLVIIVALVLNGGISVPASIRRLGSRRLGVRGA